MDLIGDERGRLARVASWLDASPAEALGLVALLAGACIATSLFVWSALGRPALPDAVGAETAAHADLGAPGPAGEPLPDGAVAETDAAPHGGTDSAAHGHTHDGGDRTGTSGATVDELTVHVAGAVHRPGVVTLPPGTRVADAVAAAGGLTGDADEARTNLARPLTDGEQVLVLREGEDAPPGAVGAATDAAGGPSEGGDRTGPLDLNTATAEQLQTLPGIGPTLAQRILRHRDQLGRFGAAGDLRDVSGIGEVRFQEIAPLVTVG